MGGITRDEASASELFDVRRPYQRLPPLNRLSEPTRRDPRRRPIALMRKRPRPTMRVLDAYGPRSFKPSIDLIGRGFAASQRMRGRHFRKLTATQVLSRARQEAQA